MKTSALIIGIMVGMCLNNPDHFDMCKAALVAALNEADPIELLDSLTPKEYALLPKINLEADPKTENMAMRATCKLLILSRIS